MLAEFILLLMFQAYRFGVAISSEDTSIPVYALTFL